MKEVRSRHRLYIFNPYLKLV